MRESGVNADNPARVTEDARRIASWIRERIGARIEGTLVLGSGWSPVARNLSDCTCWPYEEIPGLPATTIEGHPGELVVGRWHGVHIATFAGRYHEYEGHPARTVTLSAQIACELGCSWYICTNASGGITGLYSPGDLVVIEDDLEVFPRGHSTPHAGSVYSPVLRDELVDAARVSGVPISSGVLAYMTGPNYESSAEVRMLRVAGATLVSMSTLPEARAAYALSLDVGAISCVTNVAQCIGGRPLRHRDVLEALEGAAEKAGRFLGAWLRTKANMSQSH